MAATYRALASVLMLIGFYVVALLQLAAVGGLFYFIASKTNGLAATKLLLPLIVALGAVAVGLWKAIRTKHEPAPGLVLDEREAPQLWSTVRELATAVGTRAPDEIRLVPEVNAAVGEQSRLLGLVGGRRTLYVGMPLLLGLRVDQLRSVLAHELGHYSGKHTRLGEVAYRGRVAIGSTIERIKPRNPVGLIFKGYAKLYLMVDNAASRRQELEADRASVQLAGHEAATSALRSLPALDAAWNFYMGAYVESGWQAGLAPDDLFGGFGHLLQGRREQIEQLRQEAPEREASRWDTHPPIGIRIDAMAQLPAGAGLADDRPAAIMLTDVLAAGRRLQSVVVEQGDRQVLPWSEFTHASIAASLQRQVDGIYRAAGRFAGTPEPGLPTILDLVRQRRLGEFAEQFFDNATRKEAAVRFAGPMELLLNNAAVRAGQARWLLSWTGPAQFVGADGAPLDLAEVAKLAVDPQTLHEALARLTELGIDPALATVVQARASADNAGVIGAIGNVKIDGTEHDLLILDRGLILVGNPGKAGNGEKRLTALLESTPIAELAGQHRFLPYEELTSVTVTREIPLKAELTLHDGHVLAMQELYGSVLLERRSRDNLLRVFARINED
ncbi:HtpX-like protease [Micromonospora zingiberis]|uniref:HtpX-like protease n=1 Tax=Micromonospora zingiberis TaxID=2053011 RepID=A0A4R0GPV9_9ACTN|nr:M48 family metallopeptidase [Micromonospora zingiberis]TCB97631.1 HtpX-like protease [Micromonospora zingiberis]